MSDSYIKTFRGLIIIHNSVKLQKPVHGIGVKIWFSTKQKTNSIKKKIRVLCRLIYVLSIIFWKFYIFTRALERHKLSRSCLNTHVIIIVIRMCLYPYKSCCGCGFDPFHTFWIFVHSWCILWPSERQMFSEGHSCAC